MFGLGDYSESGFIAHEYSITSSEFFQIDFIDCCENYLH
jgi:hypothetical protein